MEPSHKERVGAAIAEAMEYQGMGTDELADMAEVRIETIRDILAGRTYPRRRTRNAIERALTWEIGAIARIAQTDPATGPAEVVGGGPGGSEEQLRAALARTDLNAANQYHMMAYFHELLDDQRQREQSDGSTQHLAG